MIVCASGSWVGHSCNAPSYQAVLWLPMMGEEIARGLHVDS